VSIFFFKYCDKYCHNIVPCSQIHLVTMLLTILCHYFNNVFTIFIKCLLGSLVAASKRLAETIRATAVQDNSGDAAASGSLAQDEENHTHEEKTDITTVIMTVT